MKLLLINPKFPDSFWGFNWTFENVITKRKANIPPLGLATLAALTPDDWQVTIIDENIEPIDWDADADIVGVCGMSVQHRRQREILSLFRQRSKYVIAGGSFASLCPDEYFDVADTVICGEAEHIWPQFCGDHKKGVAKNYYKEEGNVEMIDSPTPRFDLIKWRHYLAGSIQFSRGCPFRCEFCDIIVTFGRKPRTKTLNQIEKELDLLRSLGVHNVVFVDDNLIGHLPEAKKLLAYLADYQRKNSYRFTFGTEATINMVSHAGLLELFREAKFAWIFIGIESPDVKALIETKKTQNTKTDLIRSIQLIYSYGIDVFGGFIVGFDADDCSVFDRQYEFIVEAGIILSMVGLLYAPPKTPLYERLQKANRLIKEVGEEKTLINAGQATNIIPLRMTRDELIQGGRNIHLRLLTEEMIYRRIANKIRYLNNPRNYSFEFREWFSILFGLIFRGIIPTGPRCCFYFLRSGVAALHRPLQFHKLIRTVVADWAMALSLREFASRYLAHYDPRAKPGSDSGA